MQSLQNESLDTKQYSCKYCQKSFQFYQSRWRHEKKCGQNIYSGEDNLKSQEINQLQNQINEIKQERDLMKNEIEKLVTKI